MIAELKPRTVRKRSRAKTIPAWHKQYLAMLPAIVRYARFVSRDLDADAREEFIQEVVANTLTAFVRLVELNKADIAYATPLAIYAVAQIRGGRRVGTRLNVRDVSSDYCQIQKNVAVKRLDHYDRQQDGWLEVLTPRATSGRLPISSFREGFARWEASMQRLSDYVKIADPGCSQNTLRAWADAGQVRSCKKCSSVELGLLHLRVVANRLKILVRAQYLKPFVFLSSCVRYFTVQPRRCDWRDPRGPRLVCLRRPGACCGCRHS